MSVNKAWKTVCSTQDLVKDSGVCALLNKADEEQQIAIFHLPNTEQQVFAVGNYDPIGKANVLYRGIVGSVGDDIVVSSPLFKQHFSLQTGRCLQEEVGIDVFPVRIVNDDVQLLV